MKHTDKIISIPINTLIVFVISISMSALIIAVISATTGCASKPDFEYERACSYDHEEQRQKTEEVIVDGVSVCEEVE